VSDNPNALHLLEAKPRRICWDYLSANPNAIHLLEDNIDDKNKIDGFFLSINPNGIHLLENNRKYIEWNRLSENPSIFEPDIEYINENILIQAMVLDPIIN